MKGLAQQCRILTNRRAAFEHAERLKRAEAAERRLSAATLTPYGEITIFETVERPLSEKKEGR